MAMIGLADVQQGSGRRAWPARPALRAWPGPLTARRSAGGNGRTTVGVTNAIVCR